MNDLLPFIVGAVVAFGVVAGVVVLVVKRLGLFRPEKATVQIRTISDAAVTTEASNAHTGEPRLRETSAPAWAARKIDLTKPVTSIGRSLDNDVILVEDAVSATHCRIERSHNAFMLVDLGSTNKTYVNGVKVKKTPLNNGDQIRVGATTFVFETPSAPA